MKGTAKDINITVSSEGLDYIPKSYEALTHLIGPYILVGQAWDTKYAEDTPKYIWGTPRCVSH